MLQQGLLVAWLGCGFAAIGYAQGDRPPFRAGVSQGKLTNNEINEASGLVASSAHAGHFWTHNDSGDDARVFLIDDSARHRATFYLEGVVARDWEDIGMMARDGRHQLIVGDIGDNRARSPYLTIHVFDEPRADASAALVVDTIPAARIRSYTLRYEDGPRDAESLFFCPLDERLYVISKREIRVGLYGTALPDLPTDTLVLRKEAELPHTFVTAADIRADGSELLVKNLQQVFYWRRRPGESVPACLARPGIPLPYRAEPQGEAIAFSLDGRGYHTLSEMALGLPAHLYFHERIQYGP